MYRGGILRGLSTSGWRVYLPGLAGLPVPVKRALKSGSCGGGAWRPAGWWLTGLGPQDSGGLVDVPGLR